MLRAGILSNAIVSLAIALAVFILSIFLFKKSKDRKEIFTLALFWFFSCAFWFSIGLRLVFAWEAKFQFGKSLFMIGHFFAFSAPVFLIFYTAARLSKQKGFLIVATALVGILNIISFYLLTKSEISHPDITYFNSQYLLPPAVFSIWALSLGILAINLLLDIAKNRSLSSFVLILYLLLSVIDEGSIVAGSQLLFFRLSYIALCFLAYFAFLKEHQNGGQKNKQSFTQGSFAAQR